MLKKFLSSIVKAATAAGRKRLENVKNPLLIRLLSVFVNGGEMVLLALLDENQENEQQLVEIAKRQSILLLEKGAELGREKLLAFKDVSLANAIVSYLNGVEEVLKVLLDDNHNNEAQVLEIWKRRRRELAGETLDLVTDTLAEQIRKKISDPTIAGLIIEMLQNLDLLMKGEGKTA